MFNDTNIFPFSSRWSNLRNAAEKKKAKLDKALKLQQFYAETTETKVLDMFPFLAFRRGKIISNVVTAIKSHKPQE